MVSHDTTTIIIDKRYYTCPLCGAADENRDNVVESISLGTVAYDISRKEYVHVYDDSIYRCRHCHKVLRNGYYDVAIPITVRASFLYHCAECGEYVDVPKFVSRHTEYAPDDTMMTRSMSYMLIFCSAEHRYEFMHRWNPLCAYCGRDITMGDDAYPQSQPLCSSQCDRDETTLSISVQRAGKRARPEKAAKIKEYYEMMRKPFPYTPYRYHSTDDIYVYGRDVEKTIRKRIVVLPWENHNLSRSVANSG